MLQILNGHRVIITRVGWRLLHFLAKHGVVLLIFIMSAKFLTPREFGIYNYLLALAILLIVFSDFGLSAAASKYIAEFSALKDERLRGLFFNSLAVILAAATLIVGLLFVFGETLLGGYSPYAWYIAPLVFLMPTSALYDGLHRGLKRFKLLALISSCSGLVSAVLAYLLITNFGLKGALVAQNMIYALLIAGLCVSFREFDLRFSKEVLLKMGKYSLIIGSANLGAFLYSRIDVLFLGSYGLVEEISYLEISSKLLMVLAVPLTVISQVIAPDITAYFARRQFHKIKEKFSRYLKLSFAFGSISVLLVYYLKQPVISRFLPEYDTQLIYHTIDIMLVVYFTQLLNGIVPAGFAISTGHAGLVSCFLICFGILHVILNYFFIDWFGYLGILYSIVLTKVTTDLMFLLYYRHKINRLE